MDKKRVVGGVITIVLLAASCPALAGSGSGWPSSFTPMNPRSSLPVRQAGSSWSVPAARVFTVAAKPAVTAAQSSGSSIITGFVSKLNGEHNVYLSTSAPRQGWFEFKWREASGTAHLSYIQAKDLWKASHVIGFTTDISDLARNQYQSREGETVSDPVDLSKIVALDISHIGADGKPVYYGTLDMKKYDKINYGVESVSMSSDASLLTDQEIRSLYASNGRMISGSTDVAGLQAPAVVTTASGNRVMGLADTLRDQQRRDAENISGFYSGKWIPNANEAYAMGHGGWQDESGAWHLPGSLY